MNDVPLNLTWRHAMQILIEVLDKGTDEGKSNARTELMEIADQLDGHFPDNAPELDKEGPNE